MIYSCMLLCNDIVGWYCLNLLSLIRKIWGIQIRIHCNPETCFFWSSQGWRLVILIFFFISVCLVMCILTDFFMHFYCRLKDKYHPTNLVTVIERWAVNLLFNVKLYSWFACFCLAKLSHLIERWDGDNSKSLTKTDNQINKSCHIVILYILYGGIQEKCSGRFWVKLLEEYSDRSD